MTNQVKTFPIPIGQIAHLQISDNRKSILSAAYWERDRGLAQSDKMAEHSFQVLCALVFFSMALSASAQSASEVPNVKVIVERMGQARAENRARFRPYVVTRSYKLYGKEIDKVKSQVIANIAFVPPKPKEIRHRGVQRLWAGGKGCPANSGKRG